MTKPRRKMVAEGVVLCAICGDPLPHTPGYHDGAVDSWTGEPLSETRPGARLAVVHPDTSEER
jgi:hypothetical protein